MRIPHPKTRTTSVRILHFQPPMSRKSPGPQARKTQIPHPINSEPGGRRPHPQPPTPSPTPHGVRNPHSRRHLTNSTRTTSARPCSCTANLEYRHGPTIRQHSKGTAGITRSSSMTYRAGGNVSRDHPNTPRPKRPTTGISTSTIISRPSKGPPQPPCRVKLTPDRHPQEAK